MARRLISILCVAALLMLYTPRHAAADTFPNKPIRIVIPFAAGGFADIIMRLLAERLGDRLGQRVFIDNRIGGGGIVAAQAVTSSPPDGYTLFVLATGTAISVALFKSLPFDAVKDFAPISTISEFDLLLLVNGKSAIRTLDDLMAEARRRGDGMNLGTTLPGSAQNLAGALFKAAAGVNATLMPYRSTPDVLVALLRDDITAAIESYAALRAAIDEGQVRPIVSSGAVRTLPSVPTSREAGLPGFEVTGWNALFAPARTPPDVIARLNIAIGEVVASPEFRARVVELGGIPRSSTPSGLAEQLNRDIRKWNEIIDQAGIERK
jgi:tripartite-type tricarboxylate transporter receptor subunit TctC